MCPCCHPTTRYVHEMVTFSSVHGLRLYGAPETEHSWFPGFAWTIAHCG
jgi:cereblon